MLNCPACGRSAEKVSSWKVCPKMDGALICIECCTKCEHYFKNEAYIAHGCRFGADQWHDQEEDRDKRLKMIEAQIEDIYQKQDFYYRNNWPSAARKLEGRINSLRLERSQLLND